MKKKKLYTPYTNLYLILTLVFGTLTIILFSILCCNLAKNSLVSVVSALISIFGGLLASVLVAWLIDIAKCKRDNQEIIEREQKIMSFIDIWIDDLFQSFADSCYDSSECDRCETWAYWFDLLVKCDFHRNKSDFYDRMGYTYVSLNSLVHEIDLLNNGVLKEYQTINEGNILGELLLLSDSCKKLQRVIFEYKDENPEHIKFMLNDVILTLVRFWKFNEKKYCIHKRVKEVTNE